jgi:hypothetical protein
MSVVVMGDGILPNESEYFEFEKLARKEAEEREEIVPISDDDIDTIVATIPKHKERKEERETESFYF